MNNKTYNDIKNSIFNYDSKIDKTIRLSSGSYYTPQKVSIAIIEIILDDYSKINDIALNFELITKLKFIDPACGSGVFIVSLLELLFNMGKKENIAPEKLNKSISKFMLDKITAIDISGEATSNTKKAIDNFCLYIGIEKIACDMKILNDDFLLMEKYKDEFDVIMGNPPYIGEKNNKELFYNIKNTVFGKKFYEGKMDYFYFFVYKAFSCLKKQGVIGYITTNYFYAADGAKKLRNYLKDNGDFLTIIDLTDTKIFKEALLDSCIYTLCKKNREIDYKVKYKSKIGEYEIENSRIYFNDDKYIKFLKNDTEFSIIEKLIKKSEHSLSDFFNINQGIVSGFDRYKSKADNVNKGVFVLNKEEVIKIGLGLNSKFIRKFYKVSSVDKYTYDKDNQFYILYINGYLSYEIEEEKLILLHLSKYREKLSKRREVANGVRKWYMLTWPRNEEIFYKPKILVPQRALKNVFGYSEGEFFSSADIYYITFKEEYNDDVMRIMLEILNSKLIYFWLDSLGKKKGKLLELYSTPLKKIPIPDLYGFSILNKNKCDNIDRLLYKYYDLNDSEIDIIEKERFGEAIE